MAEAPIRLVDRKTAICDDLVEKLEEALTRAKAGEIEGFALVLAGPELERYAYFKDRLHLAGALHYAMVSATDP